MIHQLPLLTERQYIATIHSRLQDSQPWKLPGLQATVRLAWALALRGISQLPDVTGKLVVGHFLMRNDVSAFNNISEKVWHLTSLNMSLGRYLELWWMNVFLSFLSLKRNYSKNFFPFLVASDNSLLASFFVKSLKFENDSVTYIYMYFNFFFLGLFTNKFFSHCVRLKTSII